LASVLLRSFSSAGKPFCWIKKMIFEKTEVLFCYGKCPILILMKTSIVKPVALKPV
jgi:hypothetical protein